jgi:hypothetical protein
MRLVIAIKSGCLETESSRTYGDFEVEKSNELADF